MEGKSPNRRSTRTPKVSERLQEMRLQSRRKKCNRQLMEFSNSDDSSSDEDFKHEAICDTVAQSSQTPGRTIYGFDKKKKHERIYKSPENENREKLVPKTPHRARQKLKTKIKATIEAEYNDDDDDPTFSVDSESECSYSSENSKTSSSPDDIESTITTRKVATKVPTALTQGRSRTVATGKKYVVNTEEYFSNNANKKSVTSNHTLDRLETPRLSQDQLKKIMSKVTLSEQHQVLATADQANFMKWLCLLHEGFNVILYGLGSKKDILSLFHQQVLPNEPVVVVNGFFPSLTIKDILDAILQDCLELGESSTNVYDECDLIAQEMSLLDNTRLYLIVHNIDGEMLRNSKSQNVLTRLASIKNLHLIASIDHINAPLIWDHNKLSKFNFIWNDVTTFASYVEETSFETSMMVQKSGNLALSSLRNVFLSLTSNSKGIYLKIVDYQLENGTNQYYQGLLFKDLYSMCREAFLVSSDLALRAQLTEFVDHKMVKYRRSVDGGEHLVIPIANSLLQQFVTEQNSTKK